MPSRSRGEHSRSKCGMVPPWNKGLKTGVSWNRGLTAETDLRLKNVGDATRRRYLDSKYRQKVSKSQSEAQLIRFSKQSEVVASRKRTLKMIAEGKIVPFGGRGHGNGAAPTVSESEMAHRLAEFAIQHVVPTSGAVGAPSHYKIDFAHVGSKVAVEIDGSSHQGFARRKADLRKEEVLSSLGWLVLRFRVPFDYDQAAAECELAVSRRLAVFTTSKRNTAST